MAVLRAQKTAGGRKIQAIIRKGGFSLSRIFWRTAQAQDWARRVEDAIVSATPSAPFDRGAWLNEGVDTGPLDETKPHAGWTLGKALERYADTISPKKKGGEPEARKARAMRERDIARLALSEVTTNQLQEYVDKRIEMGRAVSTVRLELMLIRSLYRDAAAI